MVEKLELEGLNLVEETEVMMPEQNSGKSLIVIAALGLTAIVGGLLYTKVVKPKMAEHKAKKNQKDIVNSVETDEYLSDEFDDEEE